MQFINYSDNTVQIYHTRPSLAGTGKFECGGRVDLSVFKVDERNPDVLVADCPGGCGATTYVSVTGDTEAQRLHAHARLYNKEHPAKTLPEAIDSVLADVREKYGMPSVELAVQALELCDEKDRATLVAATEVLSANLAV